MYFQKTFVEKDSFEDFFKRVKRRFVAFYI